MLRVHKCAKSDDGFVMPVFLLVATKLKAPLLGLSVGFGLGLGLGLGLGP